MIHQIDLIMKLYNLIWRLIMGKDKSIKTKGAKETDKYVHEDIEGVVHEDLDMDSFKTVTIPNNDNKIVVARNKKSGELQAVRLLFAKEKKNETDND